MVISHFTSIISSTGALTSSSSTSSSSVCSSSPFGSCVGRGSAGGRERVAPPDKPLTPSSVSFLRHFLLCVLFYNNLPVSAESDGGAFLKSFIFSSSSGTAVDCVCSSTLKSHLRFLKTVLAIFHLTDHQLREFRVRTLVLCWWIPLVSTLQENRRHTRHLIQPGNPCMDYTFWFCTTDSSI